MKGAFYPKLALDGMRKNRKMFIPFTLTCTCMIMMYYILLYLKDSPVLQNMNGGDTMSAIFGLGIYVVAVFSCIFLFYTNSFLLRRRKKEFGLYNVLGMGKNNISKIIVLETFFTFAVSLAAGLILGVALSKLAELVLIRVIKGSVSFGFYVSPSSLLNTAGIFGAIFVILLINAVLQVRLTNAASLLKSESMGEKPPRGNLFIGAFGILLLAAAYYIAVRIQDPIQAMLLFFIAVIMVIIATYMIMTVSSVAICRILKKKKKYYYDPDHFVPVASMSYRMKRNGAGLASICILATMILVMLSSTTSLYFGMDDLIKANCPREINFEASYSDFSERNLVDIGSLRVEINKRAAEYGAELKNVLDYRMAYSSGQMRDGNAEIGFSSYDMTVLNAHTFIDFFFIQLEDYNALTASDESLDDGEALLYSEGVDIGDEITFMGVKTFAVKKRLNSFFSDLNSTEPTACAVLVVKDIDSALSGIERNEEGGPLLFRTWNYAFDTGISKDGQQALDTALVELRMPEFIRTHTMNSFIVSGKVTTERNFFTLYGGLFYLGIILSIVFILAAVLIIYYKQISEGYEDSAGYEIMQKVGMTKKEIRKSINSQLLIVFFLPLSFAALHLIFAFPMIRKMLTLFRLDNVTLFAVTTVVSFLIFALFYVLVYKLTSNSYFNIVSGKKEVR